jgi:dihydrofolate reductase
VSVALLVAAAENDVIGSPGTMLPWHLGADLVRFKQLTMGHPIIMGRKTFDSIGRALPGRLNIVISRDQTLRPEGVTVVSSLEKALQLASSQDDLVFVIGGGQIFEQALPLADIIYLTRVHAAPQGDVTFTYDPSQWHERSREDHPADQRNEHPYSFITLTKK